MAQNFNVLTYTGDGTTPRAITGLGFQPDFVWIKERDGVSSHYLFDSIRGVYLRVNSDSAASESSISSTLQSFDLDGFSIGSSDLINENGKEYVAWCWAANRTGVVDSTQEEKYSLESGLSIIKYTGDGIAGRTLAHSLGATPIRIYVKRLDIASNWTIYDEIIGSTKFLRLNTTGAAGVSSGAWNDTSPTSTTVTLGNNSAVNILSGDYIAYIFTDIAGFSETGSYTGNGSTTGPIVSTSIAPKYLMVKRTDALGNWVVMDAVRSASNPRINALAPNLSNVEDTTNFSVNFNIDSFQPLTSYGDINTSGGEYIYQIFNVPAEFNIYDITNVVQSDLQNMEDLFAELLSLFSGEDTPTNTVGGQMWYHSTKEVVSLRNAGNTDWNSVLLGDANQKMWVYRNDVPIGWVIDESISDSVMAIKGGSEAYDVDGGSTAGDWTQLSHTHGPGTYAAPHTHLYRVNNKLRKATITGAKSFASTAGTVTGASDSNSVEDTWRPTAAVGILLKPDL